jgi:5-methylcytosine-specific restriction endonuclease McrA
VNDAVASYEPSHYERIVAEVEAAYFCNHDRMSVVYKRSAAGAQIFRHQCEVCGELLSQQVPRSRLTDQEAATAWPADTERSDQRKQQMRDEISRRYAQFLSQNLYARQKAEFWAKYDAYMESSEWRVKRSKVLERSGGMCEGCGDRFADHVHHLTYERLGDEMLFDLVAVCKPCHEKIHKRTLDR